MGHVDEGEADFPVQAFQFALHLLAQVCVERAQGFVEQKHTRVDDERACEGHTLALSAGKLMRHPRAHAGQPDPHEPVHRGRFPLCARDAPHLETVCHVLGECLVREERIVLKHDAGVPPVGRQLGHVHAIDEYRTRGDRFQARNHAQQRRLAAPRRAEQSEKFTGLHAQIERPNGSGAAEALGDVAQLDALCVHGSGSCSRSIHSSVHHLHHPEPVRYTFPNPRPRQGTLRVADIGDPRHALLQPPDTRVRVFAGFPGMHRRYGIGPCTKKTTDCLRRSPISF